MVTKSQQIKTDKKTPRGCEIKPCDCLHEFQDQKYGKGNRVKNCMKEGKYRCSVCKKEG